MSHRTIEKIPACVENPDLFKILNYSTLLARILKRHPQAKHCGHEYGLVTPWPPAVGSLGGNVGLPPFKNCV